MFDIAGMEQLAHYLRSSSPLRTQDEWARLFGISRPHLNGILNGKAEPGRDLIQRISDATDGAVPPSAWFRSPQEQGAA
jgi:hypothetical protein